jgi:prevent-host-death family protein
MKTVNVAELKNRLSAYLQLVKDGEEVIVKDRNQPVARISPYDTSQLSDSGRRLVATGMLKLPEDPAANWDKFCNQFFARPGASISQKALIRAVIEEREKGW